MLYVTVDAQLLLRKHLPSARGVPVLVRVAYTAMADMVPTQSGCLSREGHPHYPSSGGLVVPVGDQQEIQGAL